MQDRFKFRAIVEGCCEMDTPEGYEEFEPLIFLENVDILPNCSQVGISEEDLEWAIREQHPNLKNNDIKFILECFYDDSCGVDSYIAITPKVIQQCTGLKDKNGNLIYEGDIVETTLANNSKITFLVVWNNNNATFDGKIIKKELTNSSLFMIKQDYFYYLLGNGDDEKSEIIGNVYENPELLSEEE